MKNYKMYLLLIIILSACSNEPLQQDPVTNDNTNSLDEVFNGTIDLENLANYANQNVPNYIQKDNTLGNTISNLEATLGRVLFYDTNLSTNNKISCSSCHQQSNAFSDPEILSIGVNGSTGRHSMRLVNARFSDEINFFWDERANSLEQQTTMPIQDHAEMGFSGLNGDPGINDLITKLEELNYYNDLFNAIYGDVNITEIRIQNALAQFIRSIQSFDSKYDLGRAQTNNNAASYPNYTEQENLGMNLYMSPPQFAGNTGNRIGGGLGCQGCHNAPEFDINENSRNNGVIIDASNSSLRDLEVTRAPSLRDIFNSAGDLNSPLMHTGTFDINDVIDHYNDITVVGNNNLDNRLRRGGGQKLNITQEEREALIAFLKTLSGTDMYQNEKWSNPF